MFTVEETIMIYCLLFDDFEVLDPMGSVEFLSHLPNVELHYVSAQGSLVASRQGFRLQSEPLSRLSKNAILLVPGGLGSRTLVDNQEWIERFTIWVQEAELCLSVCTGIALLAQSQLLNGRKATSNRAAWDWVTSLNNQVKWQKKARWVRDGKFYTSSGISAGMDMTLGFVADYLGLNIAENIAKRAEYIWHKN